MVRVADIAGCSSHAVHAAGVVEFGRVAHVLHAAPAAGQAGRQAARQARGQAAGQAGCQVAHHAAGEAARQAAAVADARRAALQASAPALAAPTLPLPVAPHAEGQDEDGGAAYARAQHRQRLERRLRVACGEQRTVQVSRLGGAGGTRQGSTQGTGPERDRHHFSYFLHNLCADVFYVQINFVIFFSNFRKLRFCFNYIFF